MAIPDAAFSVIGLGSAATVHHSITQYYLLGSGHSFSIYKLTHCNEVNVSSKI